MKLLLLRLLFRKMWNNRWMTLSTLVGIVVAVAFTTSIPLYSSGSLKRLITDTLQQYSEGIPPGSLWIRFQAAGNTAVDIKALNTVSTFIGEEVPARIGYPIDVTVRTTALAGTRLVVVDPEKVDENVTRKMNLVAMSRINDYTKLTSGVYPKETVTNKTLEVLVHEDVPFRNAFRLGDEFYYPLGKSGQRLKVKVVGTYVPKDERSPYWAEGQDALLNRLIMPEKLMYDELFAKRKLSPQTVDWYSSYDLRTVQRQDLADMIQTITRLDIELYQLLEGTKVNISFLKLLEQFQTQSTQLQLLLFMLAAPVLAMVYYYLFMNAKQALTRQQSDIAVLRSRGAKTMQISMLFLLEGILMGILAVAIGTVLGWYMALSIGSTSEFLTFVNRKSLSIPFSWDVLLYALGAVVFAIGSSVIPAISYARTSIVSLKRNQARSDRAPLWQRFGFDVILLAVVSYGYVLMQERQAVTEQTGLTADQLQVQPTLFFVPAVAIFALGLVFLRVFPWMLRFVQWIGKTWLPLPMYITFTQLSRSTKSYHPIMLLLMLTLGLGVYNASAARTMDQNAIERTLYRFGSTVIFQTEWEGRIASNPTPRKAPSTPKPKTPGGNTSSPTPTDKGKAPPKTSTILYLEPPFELYRTLPGVQHAARVLNMRGNASYAGKSIGQGTLMGIDNQDFAKVAWWRNDLYAYHPYVFLNQLGLFEQALLVSKNVADQYQLKLGDPINMSFQGKVVEFILVGIVPYWPTQYPEVSPFYIANLDYIYDQMPLTPYEVWLQVDPKAKVKPMLDELQKKGIQVATIKDVRNELITQRNQPSRGGVFGILSLAFIVSILVSLFGYVMYWFFQLSNRVVQFGVLRAMGLTRRELTSMLFVEQLLTAGLSIGAGVLFGRLASNLFLPFLQTVQSADNAIPPFRIVFDAEDNVRLFAVVVFMMLLGGGILLTHIRKLRVHQAIKLGEER